MKSRFIRSNFNEKIVCETIYNDNFEPENLEMVFKVKKSGATCKGVLCNHPRKHAAVK